MLYPLNTLKKSNLMKTTREKVRLCFLLFFVEYKIKRKLLFTVNTKYISSCAAKISAFSLVFTLLKNTDFSLHSMKYIWYSPQKVNILYL